MYINMCSEMKKQVGLHFKLTFSMNALTPILLNVSVKWFDT